MVLKMLVVGGGGREHAIAAALARNRDVRVYCVSTRRNPGIARLASGIEIRKETDVAGVAAYARTQGIDRAIIGPEAPLDAGVVDALEGAGIPTAGPRRAAARLETDKAFCRDLMQSHGIGGCPFYRVFREPADAAAFIRDHDGDLAVKPAGLTGGKGVRIMGEQVDREGAIAYVRTLSGPVVLEERLLGEEFTLQAFVDGTRLVYMPLVQDHKRAFEGDTGPNTGGMGSYSMANHSLPFVSAQDEAEARSIMADAVAAIRRQGTPFYGILYGQFMNTAKGPRVIEFNARFGDPEAMNVLPLLSSDFSEILCRITEGSLPSRVEWEPLATVCKYLVPEGYPDSPVSGQPLALGETGEALVYCGSVEEEEGKLATLSSRTLAVVGKGPDLSTAEAIAEQAAAGVRGRVRHRRDIGTGALLAKRVAHMEALR
ncbi:MAG: phosphoribosylamine--glycine ligase [Methanomicrobiales archaeon]|nr:phosphoribosylamine--glycine ligase [Methanomicrobiales archaeon]